MKKLFSNTILILLSLSFIIPLSACGDSNNEKSSQKDEIVVRQEFLLEQMKPISKTYSISSRNSEEIVLSNYSLGIIDLYDIYGNSAIGLNINEGRTVFHNWYSLEEDEDGFVQVDMNTVTRFSNNSYFNATKRSKHDRALKINVEPFDNVQFASLDGEDVELYNCFTEESRKILYPVVTKATQFASSKILSKTEGGWNTSHTMQYATYEILYSVISFNDTTYKSATVMQYRFFTGTWSPYEFDSLLNYGEVL